MCVTACIGTALAFAGALALGLDTHIVIVCPVLNEVVGLYELCELCSVSISICVLVIGVRVSVTFMVRVFGLGLGFICVLVIRAWLIVRNSIPTSILVIV